MRLIWKVIFIALTAIPLIAGLFYSLLYSFGLAGVLSEGFTLDHWSTLFQSTEILRSIGYTVFLVSVPIIVTPIVSVLLSYAWYKRQIKISRAFMVPMAMAPLVAAFAISQWLSPTGFLSRLAYQWGWITEIQQFPRLVNDSGSVAILATHIFLLMPILSLLMYNVAIKERMTDLEHAAQGLGSAPAQFLRKIYVPIVLLKSMPVLILYAIFIFGTYEIPLLLGRQDPRAVTLFITDKLTRFNLGDIPQAHVMILLYAILVALGGFMVLRKRSASW